MRGKRQGPGRSKRARKSGRTALPKRRTGRPARTNETEVSRAEERILRVLRSESVHPWKFRKLMEAARIGERSLGYAALDSLHRKKIIDLDPLYTATLCAQERSAEEDAPGGALPKGGVPARIVSLSQGFAFACPEDGGEDVFVPGSALGGAFLGDRVLLGNVREEARGPAGRVWRVLERSYEALTGTVTQEDGAFFLAADGALRYPLRIERRDLRGAGDGDKVLARAKQDGRGEWIYAVVEKRFGSGSSARVCADAVLERYGIPTAFPEDVLREAETVSAADAPLGEEARLDLREEKIFTVDGADAKDLDDAVSVRRTQTGYLLGVHIADVSHYVREGTALDAEAEQRGTSVYFADRVIPMLPEALSNGVCSLNAGEDKYTLSALIRFDRDGNMTRYAFHKSVIRSKVRGVYDEVNAVFDGTADRKTRAKYRPVQTQLAAARELAALLKRRGAARGQMELESGELRFVLDENGVCAEILPRHSGEAEEMIEQLMIAANTAAASFALEHDLPFLYRVHGRPERGKLDALLETLHLLDVPCRALETEEPQTADFAEVLREVRGTSVETAVHQLILRAMEKACYACEERGHFGLALEKYAHFTSPIRRYPDTVVHRMISGYLRGERPAAMHERYDGFVRGAARTSSEAEARAVSAERDAEDCYVAEYMARHIGERFPGVVTGVTQRGVFVRVPNGAEGFVSLDRFPGEHFVFDGVISHRSEKRVLTVGTPLPVLVLSAYVSAGKVDFAPDLEEEP